jgi:hypothetical protein
LIGFGSCLEMLEVTKELLLVRKWEELFRIKFEQGGTLLMVVARCAVVLARRER